MKPSFTELREYLLVQKKSLEDDGFGGVRTRWEDHKSLWAKVEFASSKDITTRSLRDVMKGEALLRKSLYRLTLRADDTLPETIRLVRKNKILQVISSPINEDAYTTLFACEL